MPAEQQGKPECILSVPVLSVQHSAGLAWAGWVRFVPPPQHLVGHTQAEAQMPGEGDSGHVPDFLGTRAWEIGEM